MSRLIFLALSIVVALFILSCAATHPGDDDRIPPYRPNLIAHIGFVGDRMLDPEIFEEVYVLGTDGLPLRDDNAGINAVPQGNEIRLQWDKVEDNPGGRGVQWINIYRYAGIPNLPEEYDDEDLLEMFHFIDRVPGNSLSFLDTFEGQHTAIGINWHYFIKAIDHAGNISELSDIRNFELINKARLESPAHRTPFTNDEIRTTEFTWSFEGNASNMRFIIFEFDGNDNIRYFWSSDVFFDQFEEQFTFIYNGPALPMGGYLWRVDMRGWAHASTELTRGSKSEMREFQITQ